MMFFDRGRGGFGGPMMPMERGGGASYQMNNGPMSYGGGASPGMAGWGSSFGPTGGGGMKVGGGDRSGPGPSQYKQDRLQQSMGGFGGQGGFGGFGNFGGFGGFGGFGNFGMPNVSSYYSSMYGGGNPYLQAQQQQQPGQQPAPEPEQQEQQAPQQPQYHQPQPFQAMPNSSMWAGYSRLPGVGAQDLMAGYRTPYWMR